MLLIWVTVSSRILSRQHMPYILWNFQDDAGSLQFTAVSREETVFW